MNDVEDGVTLDGDEDGDDAGADVCCSGVDGVEEDEDDDDESGTTEGGGGWGVLAVETDCRPGLYGDRRREKIPPSPAVGSCEDGRGVEETIEDNRRMRETE